MHSAMTNPKVITDSNDSAVDFLPRGVRIDATKERHIKLDEVGLKVNKQWKPGITRPEASRQSPSASRTPCRP
jgi:hypothetical protein